MVSSACFLSSFCRENCAGETIESFCLLGEYGAALKLVQDMSVAYADGPGGQSHQVFEEANGTVLRPPRKAAADQQWYELAGSVAANRIITGLFGVFPSLDFNQSSSTSTGSTATAAGGDGDAYEGDDVSAVDASLILRDADVPRGFNGTLRGIRIKGNSYTVTSGPNGLTLYLDL